MRLAFLPFFPFLSTVGWRRGPELAPIHEGLQDVWLGVQIAVDDRPGSLAQPG